MIEQLNSVTFSKEGTITLVAYPDGEVIGYEDPDDFILVLARYLDGHHTREHIFEEMRKSFPQVTFGDIESILNDVFANAGRLLKNANTHYLDPIRFEKYSRIVNLFASDKDGDFLVAQRQVEKLSQVKVLILGVGGTGGHTAHSLICSGIEHLVLVDYDSVELSNTSRQLLYDETDIGNLKVNVARKKLSAYNQRAEIAVENLKVRTTDDIVKLLERYQPDFVVNTMDNPRGEIRYLVDQACYERGIPYIFNGSIGFDVFVGPIIHKKKTPSYESLLPFSGSVTEAVELANLSTHKTLVIEPLNGVAGLLSAYEVVKYFSGIGTVTTYGKQLRLDINTMKWEAYDFTTA